MDEIIIVEYDPQWKTLFAEEAARIREILGSDRLVAIEHFGSTAVPGLAAKPIIDLMLGVHSLNDIYPAIPRLEAMGYDYCRNNPDPRRMFLVKGMPPYDKQRTHHLHIVEAYGKFWERLQFRDYLIQHPEEAKRYEGLKRKLANCFRNDREAYTNGKSEYIRMIMEKARREQ